MSLYEHYGNDVLQQFTTLYSHSATIMAHKICLEQGYSSLFI